MIKSQLTIKLNSDPNTIVKKCDYLSKRHPVKFQVDNFMFKNLHSLKLKIFFGTKGDLSYMVTNIMFHSKKSEVSSNFSSENEAKNELRFLAQVAFNPCLEKVLMLNSFIQYKKGNTGPNTQD